LVQACPTSQIIPIPHQFAEVHQHLKQLYNEIKNLTTVLEGLEKSKPASEPLIHRVKSLEMRVEDSQNKTQLAANQRLEYFRVRLQQLEAWAEDHMRRFKNLETRMQQSHENLDLAIEGVRKSLKASKKTPDDVEETEVKAAGNGQDFEGLEQKVTKIEESLSTVTALFQDLLQRSSTVQTQNEGPTLRRSKRLKQTK